MRKSKLSLFILILIIIIFFSSAALIDQYRMKELSKIAESTKKEIEKSIRKTAVKWKNVIDLDDETISKMADDFLLSLEMAEKMGLLDWPIIKKK